MVVLGRTKLPIRFEGLHFFHDMLTSRDTPTITFATNFLRLEEPCNDHENMLCVRLCYEKRSIHSVLLGFWMVLNQQAHYGIFENTTQLTSSSRRCLRR